MSHAFRAKYIIGNWKMHKTMAEAKTFVSSLALTKHSDLVQVGLAVPYTAIAVAAEAARGSTIAIGAQNASEHAQGAYTGEVSAEMIKDAGALFTLVGHSERRRLFHEDDRTVNIKVKRALQSGLKVVLCFGETLEEREAGLTHEVLQRQLLEGLKEITAAELVQITLAYEPVWAIGTSKAATPAQAEEAHAFCRELIAINWGRERAQHQQIQYGGSANPENAQALLNQPDIDGLLVGGASLNLELFSKLIQCY